MKKITLILLTFILPLACMYAKNITSIHEHEREIPFPQEEHSIYINPTPLIVPRDMKQSDLLQFNLSQSRDFSTPETILSKPVAWYVFNPHRELKPGVWYWRFRSVGKDGKKKQWSQIYQFNIGEDTPVFVTPTFDKFMSNIPVGHSKLYCFLQKDLPEARRNLRKHPEYDAMITASREALAMDYRTDTVPYRKISLMYTHTDYLNTAYQLFQRELYADKMVQNVRCLLNAPLDQKVIANGFKAGELIYILSCTYETCFEKFTEEERRQMEETILAVTDKYMPNFKGRVENMLYEEHFWQFSYRHFMQGALTLCDKYPKAKEDLEYFYEVWTARAPASGFNRDGNWHNGSCYLSANAITLYYTPALFSYITGTDFLQHPWYKNAGLGLAYSWQPNSMSAGFGDGHEQMNPKPLRIRSAFADLLARTTGDAYAAWYSERNPRYATEYETRLYRMVMNKQRPRNCNLPSDAPKAVWFKDTGEMIANSDMNNIRNNLSLSFHSSPFGSGNHTQSNQNAFNLHYRGMPVYRAIGFYTSYKDAHNILSYRNTRAHNTLLIDGIGQAFSPRAYGRITHSFNGQHIAYALGDASMAYRDTSEVLMWQRNFAKLGLSQSPENGFGATPLKKYKRHICFLYPDKILIYDELEADKSVEWNWLLHSPVKFCIEGNRLTTTNHEGGFSSVAELFSSTPCEIVQTNQYVSAPDESRAERGEDFTVPWSLSANFAKGKANRILTVIQVQNIGCKPTKVVCLDNKHFKIAEWIVEAELDPKRAACLQIRHTTLPTTFSYGQKKLEIDKKHYTCCDGETPVLYDQFGTEWEIRGMNDNQGAD